MPTRRAAARRRHGDGSFFQGDMEVGPGRGAGGRGRGGGGPRMHRAGPRIRRGGPPNRGGANRRGSAFGDGVPMLGSLDGSSVDRDKYMRRTLAVVRENELERQDFYVQLNNKKAKMQEMQTRRNAKRTERRKAW
eukprot:CAMPEP_0168591056 /NCGR_PEP_ID=MMETSP0420-20121227/6919_1 /TAXON_ID=498008 /ORGANISM="Pessonella sp." /LENGTH=134 /DNA_ID=CAMNT_0008626799 /DNA_START=346 /DNA_END=747 /DNA_ORIENTATION=-